MAKYIKLYYTAGYVGTDTTEIYKFEDDVTDEEIKECYKEWLELQHSWESYSEEITEEQAKTLEKEEGIEILD